MAHHKVQPFTDFPAAGMPLQDQLSPLQQKRRLGRMLFSCKLLKPAIKVFRDTQIHSHRAMVPNQYHAGLVPACSKSQFLHRVLLFRQTLRGREEHRQQVAVSHSGVRRIQARYGTK
ncbi:hypothetical protein BIU82_06570 [Arthrobacter sp. SW1]|nr:hypothetical protein BIU82_06570 [Arthrobacter sp. SW1]